MNSHEFFQNKECKYFPCHENIDTQDFNCMFCYCPLYLLGDKCNGNFTYTDKGIKDCSFCVIPHRKDNYSMIIECLRQVISLTKNIQKN